MKSDKEMGRAGQARADEAGAAEALERLQGILRKLPGAAVAFSGGLDSTLLLYLAHRELGGRVLAITAFSPVYPREEIEFARSFTAERGIAHLFIKGVPLDAPCFGSNPPDRCYHCKKALFASAKIAAVQEGFEPLLDATNLDDLDDYRPGLRAKDELGVRSPFVEAGIGKATIRELSRELGLPGAGRPSQACLASRFPYGMAVTEEGLEMVGRAEAALREFGFVGPRVRHHGEVARIEVRSGDMPRLLDQETRADIVGRVRDAGYRYVALDLEGYRTGSLNEALPDRSNEGRDSEEK